MAGQDENGEHSQHFLSTAALRDLALECPVCIEPLDDESRLSMGAVCGHVFHETCANQWKERSEQAVTCPMCNKATDFCILYYQPLASVAALLADVHPSVKGLSPHQARAALKRDYARLQQKLSDELAAASSMKEALASLGRNEADSTQELLAAKKALREHTHSSSMMKFDLHKARKQEVSLKEEYNRVLDGLAGNRHYLADVNVAALRELLRTDYDAMSTQELGNQVSMVLESLRTRKLAIERYEREHHGMAKSRMELEVRLLSRAEEVEKRAQRVEHQLEQLSEKRNGLVQRYKDLSVAVKDRLVSDSTQIRKRRMEQSPLRRPVLPAGATAALEYKREASTLSPASPIDQRTVLKKAFASIQAMERLPRDAAAAAFSAARDMRGMMRIGQLVRENSKSHVVTDTSKAGPALKRPKLAPLSVRMGASQSTRLHRAQEFETPIPPRTASSPALAMSSASSAKDRDRNRGGAKRSTGKPKKPQHGQKHKKSSDTPKISSFFQPV